MKFLEAFAFNLIKLRKDKHLSQADLADALEVSRQTIVNWEAEKTPPSVEYVAKVAHFFQVEESDLFTIPSATLDEVYKLLGMFSRLSGKQRAQIFQFLGAMLGE